MRNVILFIYLFSKKIIYTFQYYNIEMFIFLFLKPSLFLHISKSIFSLFYKIISDISSAHISSANVVISLSTLTLYKNKNLDESKNWKFLFYEIHPTVRKCHVFLQYLSLKSLIPFPLKSEEGRVGVGRFNEQTFTASSPTLIN